MSKKNSYFLGKGTIRIGKPPEVFIEQMDSTATNEFTLSEINTKNLNDIFTTSGLPTVRTFGKEFSNTTATFKQFDQETFDKMFKAMEETVVKGMFGQTEALVGDIFSDTFNPPEHWEVDDLWKTNEESTAAGWCYTADGIVSLKAHSKVSIDVARAELSIKLLKEQKPYVKMSFTALRKLATELTKRISWLPRVGLRRCSRASLGMVHPALASLYPQGEINKNLHWTGKPFIAFFEDKVLTVGVLLHELAHLQNPQLGRRESEYHDKQWQGAFKELQREVESMGITECTS